MPSPPHGFIALPIDALFSAFEGDPELYTRVTAAVRADPSQEDLFVGIAQYISRLQKQIQTTSHERSEPGNTSVQRSRPANPSSELSPKKRKLADDAIAASSVSSNAAANLARYVASQGPAQPLFVAQDVSFTLPRKKLRLEVFGAKQGGLARIQAVNQNNGEKEVVLDWKDVEQVICVPVPERAQPAYHFVVIPVDSQPGLSNGTAAQEPLVFTVPVAPAKNVSFSNDWVVRDGDTYDVLIRKVLDKELAHYCKRVVMPDAKDFVSGVVQAHRKSEKAYHVKAWRGSKDGFLYFLPIGIVFGFRKPILFFPFHTIASISYSSILQRTFNLNISTAPNSSTGAAQEGSDLEFGMLDQADFPGIDEYIKQHGLHDASLGEARRAKYYGVNKERGGDERMGNGVKRAGDGELYLNAPTDEDVDGLDAAAPAGTVGRFGESVVERAERELQDREDEEEEDYDPSGGSSEGSASESGSEDEGRDDRGGEDGEGKEDDEEGEQ